MVSAPHHSYNCVGFWWYECKLQYQPWPIMFAVPRKNSGRPSPQSIWFSSEDRSVLLCLWLHNTRNVHDYYLKAATLHSAGKECAAIMFTHVRHLRQNGWEEPSCQKWNVRTKGRYDTPLHIWVYTVTGRQCERKGVKLKKQTSTERVL